MFSRRFHSFIHVVVFFNLVWFSIPVLSQTPEGFHEELIRLKTLIEKHHVSPRKIDDKLSEDIFRAFIGLTDSRHLIFTEPDINKLKKYRLSIDNEMQGESSDFMKDFISIYRARLEKTAALIEQAGEKPFDFSVKSKLYHADKDTLWFPKDDKEALNIWVKLLKYKTLGLLFNKYGKNDEKSVSKAEMLQHEPEIREKARLFERRKIKRILQHPDGFEKYVASKFLQAVSLSFDPHSVYLTMTDLEHYQDQLSREAFSFGLDLTENEEGEIEIERLIPGGPAWKSNELHKDDVLLKLQWKDKEAVDLTGADLEEVTDMLEQTNTGILEITVRKTNGVIKTVQLAKAKIREDENVVKSFILNGDKKIGYISLPGFYSEWEGKSNSGCANDVAREILKMKKEGIEGIILDLRFNGGGSLDEGLNLAGIFINEGPLVVAVQRDRKPVVQKDPNRGTVFDGPLVVMTNGQSASASEILASTLQDYNRALIVGSRTFGKSTGQQILPVDTTMRSLRGSKDKLTGFIALTVLKLYRVTGKTAQLTGVKPDIEFPDLYDYLNYNEKSMAHALPSDSVSKKIYYTPLPPLPIKELSEKNKARVAQNDDFKNTAALAKRLSDFGKNTEEIPLDWDSYIVWNKKYAALWDDLKKVDHKGDNLKVESLSADAKLLAMDLYGKEINDILIENIKNDNQLGETYKIINDLVNLWKK
jgi:carboxyl-terminal processing protease